VLDCIAERAALVLERLADRSSPASPYLNVDEAAEYLRCDRQRFYDLLSARRLSKLKDGSRVLLLRAELDEYLQGGPRGAAAPARHPRAPRRRPAPSQHDRPP
jgi:excisionase family DNA binding protein